MFKSLYSHLDAFILHCTTEETGSYNNVPSDNSPIAMLPEMRIIPKRSLPS